MNPSAADWTSLNTRSATNPVAWFVQDEEFTEPKNECYFLRIHVPGLTGWIPEAGLNAGSELTDSDLPAGWEDGLARYTAISTASLAATEIGSLPRNSETTRVTSDRCFQWDSEQVKPDNCINTDLYCKSYECRPHNCNAHNCNPYDCNCDFFDWLGVTECDTCHHTCYDTCHDTCWSSCCLEYEFELVCNDMRSIDGWRAGDERWKTHVVCMSGAGEMRVNYNNEVYQKLDVAPTNVQKIHYTYLYSVMGHIKDANFPDSLLPGEASTFQLSQNCHSAVIQILGETPSMPPSMSGGGQVPSNCIYASICVVHWCESEEMTLTAGDIAPFYFLIYEFWGPTENNKVPIQPLSSSPGSAGYQIGQGSMNKQFCLKETGTPECPTSIRFQASSHTLYSDLKTRRKITISDTKTSIQCFNFPFEYNWNDYKTLSTGSSGKDMYFDNAQYSPPATITLRSQVLNVAVSQEGTAVAIYQIIVGVPPNTRLRIFTQVCDSINPAFTLSFTYIHPHTINSSNVKEITAISDDGSTIAIGKESLVYIYFKNLVDDVWPTSEVSLVLDTERSGDIDHVYLSASGYFLSIVQDSQLLVYQKSLREVAYIPVYPSSTTTNPVTGVKKASIAAMASGNVSIQTKDANGVVLPDTTFEVSQYCSFPTAHFFHPT